MTERLRLALRDLLDRDAPPTAEEWAALRRDMHPLTVPAPDVWPYTAPLTRATAPEDFHLAHLQATYGRTP